MCLITRNSEFAAELLRQGELIGLPTETVYGLAGNALDEAAVRKIFALKQRPSFNPLIVHIGRFEDLKIVASEVPFSLEKLAKHFWPGPLTLLLPRSANIPDIVTAGKPLVAVRMPAHPMAQEVLHRIDFPLAAPSANPFGAISPTRAEHVARYFRGNLSLVLDGGPCRSGLESTIVGIDNGELVLYRHGSITLEMLREIAGSVRVHTREETAPQAPGMLLKHYAPSTRLILTDNVYEALGELGQSKVGVLSFNRSYEHPVIVCQMVLSPAGNLQEAASRLYDALHQLDTMQLDYIVADRFPEGELGAGINDRLERASAQ
jgi:L-threonylcarbamoyladenylate synthase